ncbi:peptidase S8/S53 domain-containing protein [Blastocladiella britannica]|nr:peptidase S8/S53 domain-containing protein [Blastocladiella britannica]
MARLPFPRRALLATICCALLALTCAVHAEPEPRADPGPNPAAMPDPVALAVPLIPGGGTGSSSQPQGGQQGSTQGVTVTDQVTLTDPLSSGDVTGPTGGAAVSINLGGLGSVVTNLTSYAGERFIVQLHDWATSDDFQSHLSWIGSQLGISLPHGTVDKFFAHGSAGSFKGYCGSLHPLVAGMLASVPIIKSVERDQEVHLSGYATATETNAPWGLARIWQRGVTVASGNTYKYWSQGGAGVDVYILDTGISPQPMDYTGRIATTINFSSDAGTYDGTGHGSHVSGTVAGTLYGVAKSASLVNVKVLNSQGTGAWSGIIAGISWAVNRALITKRPSVISMSISGPVSAILNNAIQSAINKGVHVVVAAGNAAIDACNTSPASAVLTTPGLNVVGAMNQQGQFSSFSNYGRCVTILGPGEFITSVKANTSTSSTMMSGTSMATPHVTGAIAAMLSQVNMAPWAMSKYLKATATTNALTLYRTNTTSNILWLNPLQVTLSQVAALVL